MEHLDEKSGREVEELRQLVGKAREVMREECPPQPELRRHWRPMVWGVRIAAMAACVLVGIGIGKMQTRPRGNDVVMNQKVEPRPAVAVNDARPASEGELWSGRRIYRKAIEANRNEKPARTILRTFQ